nr:hypothetical protein [uncultured Sphaerochaeta sp.]
MNRFWVLILFLSLLFQGRILSQKVIETDYQEVSQNYLNIIDEIKNADESVKVTFLEKAEKEIMPLLTSKYERFSIYQWWLVFEYAGLKMYEKTFQILKSAQKEGIYFPFKVGERAWPGFISELEKIYEFDQWLALNDSLIEADQKDRKAEYIVKLPNAYHAEKKYPLIIIFTGGFGSSMALAENWKSEKLNDEFVVAYFQGNICRGSYLRSFGTDTAELTKELMQQVCDKYSVDTTKIVLAGQSAGGYRSVVLTLDEEIPAVGMLLAFPVKPSQLDEEKIKKAAERGIKAAMICGENDERYIKGQKEMGYLFDKNGLPNRFVVIPETGHGYPKDFARQIDLSLKFLFQ